jgi:hypothetical protein
MTVRMVVALTLLSACTATEPPSPAPTPPGSAAAASGASPTAQAGPPIDVSALTGRVVVSDDTQDVWVMHADGSDQRRLTAEFSQFFAWSPDGHEVMVAGASSMFVIRPDGSGLARVPVEGVPHPLFPDWTS